MQRPGTRFIAPGLDGEIRRVGAGTRREIEHAHGELEINLVTKGSTALTLDGTTHLLEPGTLVWLLPERPHRLDRSPLVEMWVIVVRPELATAAWLAELAPEPVRRLPGDELIDLDGLLSQICQDRDEPGAYNAGLTYLLHRIWRLSRTYPSRPRPFNAAVARALLYLRAEGGVPSLRQLAAEAGVTSTYLSHLLVEQTGRSFIDWRNRIRLDRFMASWRADANLASVASAAGFGSYARFHQVFTELVGCPPSEWVQRGAQPADLTDPTAFTAGMPMAGVLSGRQRWTTALGPVAASLRCLLKPGIIPRVLAAVPEPVAAQPGSIGLDASLSTVRQRAFVDELALPEAQRGLLVELLATHEFGKTCQWLFDYYHVSSDRPDDAAIALFVIVWLAASRCIDPSPEQIQAVRWQMRQALAIEIERLTPAMAQATLTALLCHFMIVYHALQATRASASPKAAEDLSAAALRFGRAVYFADLASLELTEAGLQARTD